MIKPDLQKYIQDEAEYLTTDKVDNQMEHIKKLHATCELLITIYEEKNVNKYDLMKNKTIEEAHKPL